MSPSARPAKFLFGTEFGQPESKKKVDDAKREIEHLTAEKERAEARGFERGYASGKRDQEAVELGRIAEAIERLAQASQGVLGALESERAAIEREAVDLAIVTARTLARGLIAREPTAEIMRLASEAMTNLRAAPHLVLRVAPDLVEAIEKRVKELAWQRGFEGRLIVLGEPEIPAGDCRIEWADGGFVRDERAAVDTIETSVRTYLQARAAGEAE